MRCFNTPILLILFGLPAVSFPVRGSDGLFDDSTQTWVLPRQFEADHQRPSNPWAPTELDRDASWEFGTSVQVHPVEGGQHLWADVATAPDGTIAAVWMDDHAAGGYHIFCSFSDDGGISWTAAEQIDTRTGAGAYSKFADLEFTPAGIPIVVWEDDREGNINVFFSKRDPDSGGTPWTENVRINTAGGPSYGGDYMNASLAAYDEEQYFVAWTDWREGVFHQVYMRGTTDGGQTWGTESRISDGLGFEPVAGDPCLVCDRTSSPEEVALYCVTNDWRGDVPGGRYPNVYFYRSSDRGVTWSVGVQVNDIDPYYQQASSHSLVLLDDGTLAAGWLNNPDFTSNHFHVNVSTDSGSTWSISTRVDEPSPGGTGTVSSITSMAGRVFAAMTIYTSDWDVYFRASSDGGRTWEQPMVRIDDDQTGASTSNPVLTAISLDQVVAVWSDARGNPPNWKIFAGTGTESTVGIGAESASQLGFHGTLVYPNPVGIGSVLQIALAGSMPLERALKIYDCSGRLVRTLRPREGEATWDLRDRHGRDVRPGAYWVRCDGWEEHRSTKVILNR